MIKNNEQEKSILKNAYQNAQNIDFNAISSNIKINIDVLISQIDSNKSLVSALVTSLLKKIITPTQDIRLHRTDFENGYSARVLDTQVTSPFFKDNFPKYANKESSFLTLATRERIKWTKIEGLDLKIRNKQLKDSFITIFDDVEIQNISPNDYLEYVFAKLIILAKATQIVFENANFETKNLEALNIHLIIKMLEKHFEAKLSSRLPVIAIYSIYEALLPKFERYKDKKLVPLQVHTSSDKHGFGDIEIYTLDNQPFEIIEIKHNIPIDKYLIFDIAKKSHNTNINRYYILTTFKNGFKSIEAEKEVINYILELNETQGIDIIANGISSTLKYYLRFIDDYQEFIKIYTKNLIEDAEKSTEIKDFHLEQWADILKDKS